jgi:hypothetical protein
MRNEWENPIILNKSVKHTREESMVSDDGICATALSISMSSESGDSAVRTRLRQFLSYWFQK